MKARSVDKLPTDRTRRMIAERSLFVNVSTRSILTRVCMMTKDAVRIEPKVLKIGKCLSKKSLANLQSIAWRGDSCKAQH